MVNESLVLTLNCSSGANEEDFNTTSVFTEEQTEIVRTLHYYLYGIIIPVVCLFGILGNILNVVIFTRKKNKAKSDEVEYCTTICLVSLAVSDMMFCIATFPFGFQTVGQTIFHRKEFMLYYIMYSSAFISIFILSSTMLTVLTALMRYLVVCHPFRSRQLISVKATSICVVVVVLISIAFNFVSFWQYVTDDCMDEDYTKIHLSSLFSNSSFKYTQKLLWAVFGNFVPLSILLYCNLQLIRALRQSRQLRLRHSRDDTSCLSAHRRINITLVTIIIFFFILVAPSEITKFIMLLNKDEGFSYVVVSLVTNTLQCINFSVNFVLYYVIIAPFRLTLHEYLRSSIRTICRMKKESRSSDRVDKEPQTEMLLFRKENHHRHPSSFS